MKTLDLHAFKAARANLPNGGAILTLHGGKLCSPLTILEEYPSQKIAVTALRAAGFIQQTPNRWK